MQLCQILHGGINNSISNIGLQLWLFLLRTVIKKMILLLVFHFDICEMTEMGEMHLLNENRILFLELLAENNVVKFQELLNKHPDYIYMQCIADGGVSYRLA